MQAWSLALGVGQLLVARPPCGKQRQPDRSHFGLSVLFCCVCNFGSSDDGHSVSERWRVLLPSTALLEGSEDPRDDVLSQVSALGLLGGIRAQGMRRLPMPAGVS